MFLVFYYVQSKLFFADKLKFTLLLLQSSTVAIFLGYTKKTSKTHKNSDAFITLLLWNVFYFPHLQSYVLWFSYVFLINFN